MVRDENEATIISEVSSMLQGGGYTVGQQGFGLFPRMRPDFVVEKGGHKVAVEVQQRPIVLADIVAFGHLPVPTIICVPEEARAATPESVLDYAKQLNVQVCSPSDVFEVVGRMIG